MARAAQLGSPSPSPGGDEGGSGREASNKSVEWVRISGSGFRLLGKKKGFGVYEV